MATTKVTDATFEKDVLSAPGPVVVDFWAEWCGPCKAIAPGLEEISETLKGKVTIAKLDVDANQQVAQRYNISAIPTLIIFKNGQVAAQKMGGAPKSQLLAWIQEHA
ncbi:MAG TPA: thioredoxin [Stellaceae bacterium]|nr:thioredoxin [Stellaceae bacterium]